MQNKEKLYNEWIAKANEDELSAQSLLKHKDAVPGTVCYLSQQIAEKLLKALLLFYGKDFPKIHDLLALETSLLQIVADIKTIHHDLNMLNAYYIEARYPGDYPEFSWQDAQEAFDAALRIKDFVFSKITSEHE
jgi:HEPN domain-containing protein